jgi:hypothetical protein
MLSCGRFRLLAIRAVAVMLVLISKVRKGRIVAATEAFTVFFATLGWNRWLAKFPLAVHIVGALFRDVSAGGFDAIVNASALHLVKLRWRRIPWAAVMVRWRARLHHGRSAQNFLGMSKGYVIAPSKTIPIVIAEPTFHCGMAKLLVHFGVGGATRANVPARGLNSIVEALLLNVAEFLGRGIPSAAALIGAVLRSRVRGGEECGRSQSKSNRCESNSRELHRGLPPCRSCTPIKMVPPSAALSLAVPRSDGFGE